jgi:hypothetical protein
MGAPRSTAAALVTRAARKRPRPRGRLGGPLGLACCLAIFGASVAGGTSTHGAAHVRAYYWHGIRPDCAHPGYKPRVIYVACADGGIQLRHIHWKHWNSRAATGKARARVNDCTPSCADGHFHRYRATVRLSGRHFCSDSGRYEYTHFYMRYMGRKPAGSRHLREHPGCSSHL